jgi:CMP-N,N'-diacetyllegionaminic acid synthase
VTPRVLAVIPARGGSKGLPRKNVLPLAGLPLVVHSVLCAGLVQAVTRCIVSTDDDEIARTARSAGADVPFLRPTALSGDEIPMAPVIAHAVQHVEAEEDGRYDAVLLLDPTSPCRVPEQIDEAIARLLRDDSLDGVVSVSEPVFNPTWVGVRHDGSVLERYFPDAAGIIRRQDTERYLRVNGNFYAWRSDFVRRMERSWLDEGRHAGFEIPESQAFSIDDEYEFRLIEAMLDAGLVTLPWLGDR